MDSFENLISELTTKSKLNNEEVLNMVDKKYSEMRGLITKEGATYLVARELNVELTENIRNRVAIKSIQTGMRNINITGRIFKISKVNEFRKSNGSAGRVANIFIGDITGYVRLPLWDEQVNLLEEHTLNLGDVVQVTNAFSRENTFGDVEISLGRFGSINSIEDTSDTPSIEELSKTSLNIVPERTPIANIAAGNFELRGVVVNVFKGNFLFTVCSICHATMRDNACPEHGDAAPSNELVVSFILDDGSGEMRCVAFRETAEAICDVTAKSMWEMNPDKRYELINEKLIGRELILVGRVRKNKMFDKLEMAVNEFKTINALDESKRLVDELELMAA